MSYLFSHFNRQKKHSIIWMLLKLNEFCTCKGIIREHNKPKIKGYGIQIATNLVQRRC